MENTDLLRKHRKISTNLKGKKKEATGKTNNDDQRTSLHAQKFCVMNEIFVSEAAFLTEDPNFDPMDLDRYISEDSIRKGVISELFEEVPKNLHDNMRESATFRDLASYNHLILNYHSLSLY